MALLLTLLTLGCYKQKALTFDFGQGSVELPKDFRYDSRKTDREPESVRFTFTRVNDTHINGQTSYAEHLVVSVLAPNLSEAAFRHHLNKGLFDAQSTRQPYSTEIEGNLEFQISATIYEQHPVKEKATVIRLIDKDRRLVLGWYGYNKRYSVQKAKDYLKATMASLVIDPNLYTRFDDYEKWKGNDWMGPYFDNQKLLGPALDPHGLESPYQGWIGAQSSWSSNGNLHIALDGERPASLNLVVVGDAQPCSNINDISPELRLSFRQIFDKKPTPACFKVHKLNFWQTFPTEGNAIKDWLNKSIAN